MDGSDREVFLDNTVVALPNSLAVDWDTDELCFADAGKKTIACVHIETKQLRTVATKCSYPFGIAISPTHYYWTDWATYVLCRLP
jgi:nidogen (entactin)